MSLDKLSTNMPTLKQVKCSVVLDGSDTELSEHRAHFTDGAVETYIAVPDVESTFHICIRTYGYIAPGIAAFVYIDGSYQCNRNRPAAPANGHCIEFRLRQKEERVRSEDFVGRAWTFTNLKTDAKSRRAQDNFIDNVGTIEVVILRCSYAKPVPLQKEEIVKADGKVAQKSNAKVLCSSSKPTRGTPSDTDTISNVFGALGWDGAGTLDLSEPRFTLLAQQQDGPGDEAWQSRYKSWRSDPVRQTSPVPPRTSVRFPERNTSSGFNALRDHDRLHLPTILSHGDRDVRRSDASPDRHQQCLYTVKDIFDGIESCISEQMPNMTDKIGRIESALRDAQGHAPSLIRDLERRRQRALQEKDNLLEAVTASLQTALGYMSILDRAEWRVCRDTIVRNGWLQPDHPWLVLSARSPEEHDLHRAYFPHRGQEQETQAIRQQENDKTKGESQDATRDHPSDTARQGVCNAPAQEQHDATQTANTHTQIGRLPAETQSKETNHPPSNRDRDEDHNNSTCNVDGGWADSSPLTNQAWNDDQNSQKSSKASRADRASQAESRTRSKSGHKRSPHGRDADEPKRVIKSYWRESLDMKLHEKADIKRPMLRHDPYIYPAEPTPALPKDAARKVSHGVQIGKGVDYCHQTGTPEYIDTLQNPYAVFTFKYRNKKELEKTLGRKVMADIEELNDLARRQQFVGLSREDLIRKLIMSEKKSKERSKSHRSSDEHKHNGPDAQQNNWVGDTDKQSKSSKTSNHGSRHGSSRKSVTRNSAAWGEPAKASSKARGNTTAEGQKGNWEGANAGAAW